MLIKPTQTWFGVRFQFEFNEQGSIRWDRRPFSKTWSWRKLGNITSIELILSCFSEKNSCLHAVANQSEDELEILPLKEAARLALKHGRDSHSWLIDTERRWIVEIITTGSLTIERLGKCVL